MYVAFHPDGTFGFWFPTGAEARGSKYRLDGTRFAGWLGLTNDLTGTATATFATRDRLELVYPDKSIASFRRISRKSTAAFERRFHCIPYTVRGQTFDERTVRELKKQEDSLKAGSEPPPTLIGTWILIVERPVLVLEIGKDKASMRSCPSVVGATVPENTERREGAVRVFDNYLVTTVISCGQPTRFEASSARLVLHISATEHLTLVRAGTTDTAMICRSP